MEKEREKLIEHFKVKEMIGAACEPKTFREMVVKDIYEAKRGNTEHKSLAEKLLLTCFGEFEQENFLVNIKEKAKLKMEELVKKKQLLEKEFKLEKEKREEMEQEPADMVVEKIPQKEENKLDEEECKQNS